MSNVAENSYGTGGSIRRTRDKFTFATPTRDSPLFTTAWISPLARESTADFLTKKNFDLGSYSNNINITSANSKVESPEARVRNVHPHSNRLAWKILEQLDRPVTLKEHSKELSLAVSQLNASVHNKSSPSMLQLGFGISKDADGVAHSGKTNRERNALPQENNNAIIGVENGVFGSMISASVAGVANGPSPSFEQLNSQRSSERGTSNNLSKMPVTITNNPRIESQNSQRKPILPPIAIEKSSISSSFSLDTSLGFTFPVTTSTFTSIEPPTPSVVPSFLTSSPPPPKVSTNLPTFIFSNKITIAPPVVAFLSKTDFTPNNASAPKFKFGSEKPRLSFAVLGKDTPAFNDAAMPRYKFVSGESRLNFGSVESDAFCC